MVAKLAGATAIDPPTPAWLSLPLKALDDASALPAEYPGWASELQNSRDPRGTARMPTKAEIRAAAERLK